MPVQPSDQVHCDSLMYPVRSVISNSKRSNQQVPTMPPTAFPSPLRSSISVTAVFSACSNFRVQPTLLLNCKPPISKYRLRSLRPMSQLAASESSHAVIEAEKNVLVQYVVLRRDLIDSWPLGSVVAQGCHASVSAIWMSKDDHLTAEYCSPSNIDSMHKVTLEVKGETQIVNLSEKLKTAGIDHKLWTEQPENIPTCLATKPYHKSTVALYFKKLKLCK